MMPTNEGDKATVGCLVCVAGIVGVGMFAYGLLACAWSLLTAHDISHVREIVCGLIIFLCCGYLLDTGAFDT